MAFRVCDCGARGGSCAPHKSTKIVRWMCFKCREKNTQLVTVSAGSTLLRMKPAKKKAHVAER